MQRQLVSFSNLKSVGYDSSSRILEIEFQNGTIYDYYGVPMSGYRALMKAPSHGQYFHRYIRDHYRYRRVK